MARVLSLIVVRPTYDDCYEKPYRIENRERSTSDMRQQLTSFLRAVLRISSSAVLSVSQSISA